MLIRRGVASEYARDKFDIEVDETDLERMLAEAGCPQDDLARLPTLLAYKLLELEAEQFILRYQVARGHKTREEAGPVLMEVLGKRKAALTEARTTLGYPVEPAPAG